MQSLQDPFPAEFSNKDPETLVAVEQADYYLVGFLMIEHTRLWDQDKSAAGLVSYLLAREDVNETRSDLVIPVYSKSICIFFHAV